MKFQYLLFFITSLMLAVVSGVLMFKAYNADLSSFLFISAVFVIAMLSSGYTLYQLKKNMEYKELGSEKDQ